MSVLGLLLPVEILQLAANLDDAGKVWAVLDAELGLFLFEFAAAGLNLLEQSGGEVAVFGLEARIGGDDQLRVALRSRSVLGLAQDAVGGGGYQLAAQLIDLHQGRGVLGLAGLAVGQRFGRGQQAMLALEGRQPLFVLLDAQSSNP